MHLHDEFIRESEPCFAVMGRDGQFSLYEVTAPGPLDRILIDADVAAGRSYCGVVGLCDGLVLTRHEPDPDSWRTVICAARAVARLIGERIEAEAANVEWLEALYELEDPRPRAAE